MCIRDREREKGGRENAVEEGVRSRMVVVHDHTSRNARVVLTQLDVHPMFPVRMAQSLRGRGEQQLSGNEYVVGDGVRGQMGEVPKAHGFQSITFRSLVNLLTNVPAVTMATFGRVLLGKRYIGRDGAVEEVVRMGREDRS